jgi:CBS domain-containing protein
MRCEDIMKRDLAWVLPDDNAHVAARKMRDDGVGFLPVCDGTMRPLGALTDRDICLRVAAEDKRASNVGVRDIMTLEVVTIPARADVADARRLMGERQKSRLICVNDQDKLVGVLSLSDLAEAAAGEAAETLREVADREVHPPTA